MPKRRLSGLLVLMAAVLSGPGRACGQERLFAGSRAFPLESSANALAVEDFDLDGSLDVAALGSGNLSVLLSDPARTFLDPVAYSGGTGPVALAARDLDHDADPDLVVSNSGSSTLSVLLNGGDGSFAPAPHVPVGLGPRALALDDFNRDTHVDIASSNLGARTVDIRLGNGSGGFSTGEALEVGDNPHSLVSGDFDGDSMADFVVAHSGAVSWFQGVGDGTFAPPVHTSMVPDPRVLTAGDFVGDALPDLAVVNDAKDLLALENLGGGRFREDVIDTLAVGPFQGNIGAVEMVDFDVDGVKDLLVVDFSVASESLLRIYRGVQAGDFEKAQPIFLGALVPLVAVRDMNADGLLDVVAPRASSPELLLFEGIAPGRVAARTVLSLDGGPRGVTTLDSEGDGTVDLAAYSSDALHAVKIEADAFEPPIRAPFTGSAFLDMTRGDFDGDGRADLALADLGLNEARLVFFEGGAVSARTRRHALRGLPSHVAAADLDGDALSDLVAGDGADTSLVLVFRPADEGSVAVPLDTGTNQTSLAVEDFDADGSLDIAVCGRGGTRLFLGDGRRGFPGTRDIDALANAPELRAADVDGDAVPDLIGVARSKVVIVHAPATPGAPRTLTVDFGVEIRPLEVGDADQDGRADLVAASWSTVVVARREPGGGYGEPQAYGVGQSPRGLALHDLDGDGVVDVATADYAARSLSVLHGTGSPGGTFRRGDADSTGTVDLSDGVAILNALFLGAGPLACPDAADADDDGVLNLTDAIAVLLHLFVGGAEPPPPGPGACGPDPSPDGLERCGATCR